MLLARRSAVQLERALPLLDTHLVGSFEAAVDPATCAAWVRGVYAARDAWIGSFGDSQWTLGRAWYTDLEEERAREYFESARDSDALVEAHMPGMQARVRALVGAFVGATPVIREGWCGPGVHIFPAGEEVARDGGVMHFDTEGLAPAHLAARAPALSLVLMLQPPDAGGGLRVWDLKYAGSDEAPPEASGAPSVVARYGVGDLVAIDSYRLHQIQAFGGERDRVSVTCHAAFTAGRWETWF